MSIIEVTDLPADLRTSALAEKWVAGANSKAMRVAPCLGWDGSESDKPRPTDGQIAEALLILLGAVQRWAQAGSGALQSQAAGPFSQTIDTRQRTGYNLWPSEITDLQAICSTGPQRREAFSIDTAPGRPGGVHLPWCDLNMGGADCSCGTNLAGHPIYELG